MRNSLIIRASSYSKRDNYFASRDPNHGAWLDHEISPAYFKLTAWIAANVARMSMDIRVHVASSDQHE